MFNVQRKKVHAFYFLEIVEIALPKGLQTSRAETRAGGRIIERCNKK
jgi:hypothetical protein